MKKVRKYSCPLCLKKISNTFLMKLHTDEHIRKGDEPQCPFCGSFHANIEALRKHMRKIHNWFSGETINLLRYYKSSEDNGAVNLSLRNYCKHCLIQYRDTKKFQEHMKKQHKENWCCSRKFITNSAFALHKKLYHSIIQCPEDSNESSMNDQISRNQHKETVHGQEAKYV